MRAAESAAAILQRESRASMSNEQIGRARSFEMQTPMHQCNRNRMGHPRLTRNTNSLQPGWLGCWSLDKRSPAKQASAQALMIGAGASLLGVVR